MKKRLLVFSTAILFLATVSVHATYSYFYTENLASPTWSNWVVTGTNGDTLKSQYYSAGGYGGLTGYGWMLYPSTHWGGGEVSMTYRKSGPGSDFFTAYLGSHDNALARGYYDYVQVDSGGLFVDQVVNGNDQTLGYVFVSIPDNSVIRAVAVSNSQGGDTIGVYVNNVLAITVNGPSPNIGYGTYWGVGAYASDPTDGNVMSSVSLGYQDSTAPNPVALSSITSSAYYNTVDLQWAATTDDTNGTGIYDYSIYRNGQFLASTQSLSYSDTAGIVPSTHYTYTIVASDYHFNTASTNYSVTTPAILTNPPYPSTTPEGRQVGVRPTGAYWGASGENIDVRSGNLSFSQPLLSAQGRNGWSVGFNLIYDSQNWRKDSGGVWEFGADVGYGFGWRLMAGSITPVWNPGGLSASQYIYTDSTGAEYHLNQNNSNIWSSQESIYVWFDANANILHFRDGSFWNFGCISAGAEPDSGVMYPTLIEDTNGNRVLIRYQTSPGANWTNSSSPITQIEDVRATDPQGVYYTYAFTYNNDSPVRHLTSIANSIGTGEHYSFTYNTGQTLYDPFLNNTHGTTAFLSRATISNIGTYYQFTTDSSGELTQIQLPYKGYLAYAYTTTTYGNGRSFRELNNRYLSKDGSTQTTYAISHESSPGYDVHQLTAIEDPGGVGEKYWAFNGSGTYEGLASTYQGRDRSAGGPSNCLSGNTNGLGTCKTEIDYTWMQDTTGNSYLSLWYSTLDPGQSYAIQTSATQSMDIHGNVTGVTSNNYSSTGGGWHYSGYSYLSSSNYTSRYIFNRLSSTLIQDPSNVLTMATITYDCGYGCIGSGSSPTPREWDTAYTSIGYRGNATTVAALSGTSTAVYDLYGNTASGTGASGVSSSITTTSATNYAAPVQVTVGGSLTTNLSYSNSFLGLTNETGPNGTSVSLGYDASARPNSSTSPFGASTYTIYNDTASPPNTCTIIDGRWTQTNLDGLGRPILSLTGYGSSCGSGTTLTQAETTYDSCGCSPLGKLKTQAVPHAYGTSTSTTAITTYTYDGIGRTLSKAVVGAGSTPDTQGTTTYSYQGNTVTVTDPAGKWKTFTTDGYGNLVQVTEPNPAGGSNFTTSYTYDLLKRLIGVSMPRFTGTQTRSWTYSGAFLTSATNPENGTVSYTYGSNNHVATRTDAKGQVVTYTYDSLARLSKVQRYPTGLGNSPDACQEEDYYYNGSNPLGSSYPLYAQGRLSAVQYWGGHNASASPTCDTTFTELYTYGVPGAPTGKQLTVTRTLAPYSNSNQTQPMSLTWNATYTYDTEGRTTAETYPTDNNGATASLSYTFDQMGRLNAMTDNIAMQTIIASTTYGPANEITSITGASGGWSGETLGYNSLKQLTSLSSGGGLNLSYSYPTTGNNGKIQSQTDAISGETVTYTYDSLNRLATAENQTGFSPSWGQSFTYDGFGNLTGTSVIKGSAPTMAATYDVNNHAGGEDANGNPGYVPAPAQVTGASAVYDVENRLGTVSEGYTLLMNYSYAPGNKRVWRGNGGATDEVTFYSVSGRKLGCYQITFTQGTTGYYYVAPQFYYTQTGGVNLYFGGKLIKNKNGWVYPDRLGSIGKYYPYGIERPSATTNDTEKFTGYFRDAETGNDYADQRYESPGTGRFLTVDRMLATSRPGEPNSWNKYAYTGGDPINRVDQNGTDYEVAGDVFGSSAYGSNVAADEVFEYATELNDAIADPTSPCYGEE